MKFQRETEDLIKINEDSRADPFSDCPHCVENIELKEKYDTLTKTEENIADLAEAENDSIDLDVFEDSQCDCCDSNTTLTQDTIEKVCDQAEVVGSDGPYSESIPTAEEFIEAVHEVLADPKNHLEVGPDIVDT